MQLLFLNPLETFFLNVIAWGLFHLGIGFYSSKMPVERFDPGERFCQSFHWEKEGRIYQQLFHVRSWKHFIPQGSRLYPDTFSLQNLPALDPAYLDRWLRESVRAEFCHWLMIIPSVFFFLWNSAEGGWVMVAYALLSNFFPIVAQRYNRPRIQRFLEQARRKTVSMTYSYAPAEIGYELFGSGLPDCKRGRRTNAGVT